MLESQKSFISGGLIEKHLESNVIIKSVTEIMELVSLQSQTSDCKCVQFLLSM